MMKTDVKIEKIKEELTVQNKTVFNTLSKSEQRIFTYLGKLKSEYFTFLSGFISAILIEKIMNVFCMKIAEDVSLFLFSSGNIVLFGVLTYNCLLLSISYSDLEKLYHSKPTDTAGLNSLLNAKELPKMIAKVRKSMVILCVFSCIAVVFNLVQFILINVC